MATQVAELVAKLRMDNAEFDKGADAAASKMSAVGDKMQSVGKKMTIGLTAPLALLGKASFDAASDLNESMSKVKVVFDDMAPAVVKWSKTSATAMGISQQAALEAAGTFGTLAQAMGVMQGPATDMSMKLVQLASDIASFNNANTDEVLLALRAGLVGEAEPLRKFGVSLSAARVEAEALASGLVKPVSAMEDVTKASIEVEKANIDAGKALKEHGKDSLQYREALSKVTDSEKKLTEAMRGKVPELTAAQKMQASYNIIMKDTALAQGDFARTADGAANKQRILQAQFKDMQAELGQALIPIFQKVAGVLQEVAAWFSNLTPKQQEMIVYAGLVVAALGPVIGTVGTLIKAFQALSLALTANPYVALIAASAVAAILIATHWNDIVGSLEGGLNSAISVINGVLDKLNELIRLWNSIPFLPNIGPVGHVGRVGEPDNGPWKSGPNQMGPPSPYSQPVTDTWLSGPNQMGPPSPYSTPVAGPFLGFATGGVVPGPIGAPVPAIVHGGETIIPAGGGGAQELHVYLDGREIEAVVRRRMVQNGKRNNSALGAYA